jgi:hypothetical protein
VEGPSSARIVRLRDFLTAEKPYSVGIAEGKAMTK